MEGKPNKQEEKFWNYYSFEFDKIELIQQIMLSPYEVMEEFKNDKRTYVAKILFQEKEYIFKKIYHPKKRKHFLSRWKTRESLRTLINIEEAIAEGIQDLAQILAIAIHKIDEREENILMPYYEGEKIKDRESFFKVMDFLKLIHSKGRFHGDCNPNNFLITEEKKLWVLDTKMKRFWFGNYRAHYDMLTWLKHKPQGLEIAYPYRKNLFYYFATGVRKFRNMKNKRKDLRDDNK